MTTSTRVLVTSGYEPVADAFDRIVRDDPEGGAALAVYVDGRPVVDLGGGLADPATRTPWSADTLALIFSCTKALLATCANVASREGHLDLDAPIAGYWPAFAQNDKAQITARMVLSHSAGLSALDTGFGPRALFDSAQIVRALELQRPLWSPGSGHAYHAMTYGWLVAEILRRSTGETLGDIFARLFGGEGSSTWLGTPAAQFPRVATASWDRAHAVLEFPRDEPGVPWTQRAATRAITLGGALDPELVGPRSGLNDPVLQAAGVPALGAVSTARSLARVWSTTIVATEGREPLLDPQTIQDVTACLEDGPSVLGAPGPWPRWATGYMLDSEFSAMLGPESFGHDGAGGQLTFADTRYGVGFAFVTNRLRNVEDDRATSLVSALRGALSERFIPGQEPRSSSAP